MTNQQWQEPFLAIVVDPVRTMSSGKVEIGAFRTYPEGYKAPVDSESEYQTIPLSKIEDFGVHSKSYYSLPISFFKNGLDSHMLDLLWNKYWVNTLSSNPLVSNRDFSTGQVVDVRAKLEKAEGEIQSWAKSHAAGIKGAAAGCGGSSKENALTRVCRDTSKIASEQLKGLSSHIIKNLLFNSKCACGSGSGGGGGASTSMAVDGVQEPRLDLLTVLPSQKVLGMALD
jgi:COP9 signalosome complex subunit 5